MKDDSENFLLTQKLHFEENGPLTLSLLRLMKGPIHLFLY